MQFVDLDRWLTSRSFEALSSCTRVRRYNLPPEFLALSDLFASTCILALEEVVVAATQAAQGKVAAEGEGRGIVGMDYFQS